MAPRSKPNLALAGLCALASLLSSGCAAINQKVDHWALEMKADMVLGQKLTWTAGVDLPYRSSEELEL
ncbi:MAG: hypothetical protein QM765_32365 [Myxococcales bacterium]